MTGAVNKVLDVLKNSVVEIGRIRTVDQTFVAARQDQDINLTANTPETIPFNVEAIDETDEFDSGQFVPQDDGFYRFSIAAEFSVGADQDELKLSVVNDDTDTSLVESEQRTSGGNNRDRRMNAVVELDAGTPYVVQAENSDNDDTINGKPKRTRLTIEQALGGYTGQ